MNKILERYEVKGRVITKERERVYGKGLRCNGPQYKTLWKLDGETVWGGKRELVKKFGKF